MKAIIPVAGIGSRLKPHTHTQPKSLIPLAGKPILGHILDNLKESGITDFVFVIGYLGDKIEQYISKNYADCNCEFVIQTLGKGIGHAIWLTREKIDTSDDILIVLGDTIFEANLKPVLSKKINSLGVKKVEDPRLFGVVEINQNGLIKRLTEKPAIPKSNQALVGLYYIHDTQTLMQKLQFNIENEIKTQNEFHLTDALQQMIEEDVVFETFSVDNWFDCGKKEIILQTNKNLLHRASYHQELQHVNKNNIVVPPVYIAPNAVINNSIIGPNVSIGENAIIERSIVCNTIIGPFAELTNAVLEDSLIGSDAVLVGAIHHLNIGDSAEINLKN